jgi:hypothetical protein
MTSAAKTALSDIHDTSLASRIVVFDYLRTFGVRLVLLHHTLLACSDSEPPAHSTCSRQLLLAMMPMLQYVMPLEHVAAVPEGIESIGSL